MRSFITLGEKTTVKSSTRCTTITTCPLLLSQPRNEGGNVVFSATFIFSLKDKEKVIKMIMILTKEKTFSHRKIIILYNYINNRSEKVYNVLGIYCIKIQRTIRKKKAKKKKDGKETTSGHPSGAAQI